MVRHETTGPGTVYLVGAGPGHPGLITRMGYDVLQRCDAVAYDALIPLELIAALPGRVERYYVGRRAGRHSMPQQDKNHLLVSLALRGLDVVRLKGGDTSFFAHSSDDVETLTAAGIPVVVIPGVTAASAVAATAGLSITDRRAASWAFFATGHGASNCEPIPIPWREVAGLSGGTIVVYMGLSNLEQIACQLIQGGTPPGTPCLVVQRASSGVERVLESNLGDAAAACRREKLEPPALVVIGEVIRHRHRVAGRKTGALSGKRVLVTCCARETERLCGLLRGHGAEPLPYPAFALEEVDDAEGWSEFGRAAGSGGWCVFTSEIEVHGFVDGLLRHDLDLRTLGRFRIAALGERAAAALRGRGLKPDLVSRLPLDEALLRGPGRGGGANNGCVITFLDGTKPSAPGMENPTGWARIIRLRLFESRPAAWESHWVQELAESPPDYIIFTNPEAVAGYLQAAGPETARRIAARSCVISAGSPATTAAQSEGLRVDLQLQADTPEALVDIILRRLPA